MSTDKREFYAETVQEAVDKAAASLGVSPEELTYSVIDAGSSGFLGIGARDARISVEGQNPSLAVSQDQNIVPTTPPPVDQGSSVFEDTGATEQHYDSEEAGSGEVEVAAESSTGVAPEDLILAVDGFVTELLGNMGFDATVDAYDAGEVIKVDVATKETGLLIGQKGETIDAIQYLLNVVIYRNRPFVKRAVVDTEGYRQRRVEALQGMAHRTARRAQREKRRLDLPPMAAAERRVVHLYLKENPNVSTTSEGSEEDRRVVIIPNE